MVRKKFPSDLYLAKFLDPSTQDSSFRCSCTPHSQKYFPQIISRDLSSVTLQRSWQPIQDTRVLTAEDFRWSIKRPRGDDHDDFDEDEDERVCAHFPSRREANAYRPRSLKGTITAMANSLSQIPIVNTDADGLHTKPTGSSDAKPFFNDGR
ncbi:uncharacterized protein LOC105433578 [Pogonomyrmex barbatus]|uniref:Uncharacterized protein LOC105433578 n=1 Tax=Pogonomyrmex barbatus TaxID=144034 RepID=A0A6I9WV75_9HYME|nr:uncharacterized protein LOC105433578 [Pogonomyrmex barbatus]